ncbi:MAG: dodecin family protein [Anaerolineales bacterium]
MKENVYKKIEITGTSGTSLEDAINNAIAKASETVRNMRWFEMTEIRGRIDGVETIQWQVTIKIGFTLED